MKNEYKMYAHIHTCTYIIYLHIHKYKINIKLEFYTEENCGLREYFIIFRNANDNAEREIFGPPHPHVT